MRKTSGHSWRFKARFRRHAFGWKSQPANTRLHEAVSEITLVARIDPKLGAEGAVALLERVSPALENVDSSSGAIGTAVNHTIAELVPVIVAAPADASTRAGWLERLFDAHSADQIPYIYLCGGVATLLTARVVGRLADGWGKFKTFRVLAVAVLVPMVAITQLEQVAMGWVLLVSTLFFVCMSGRMIPGMAMLTSAANPALRGTFMTLNSAVQSGAMGVAALVGGYIISRDTASCSTTARPPARSRTTLETTPGMKLGMCS